MKIVYIISSLRFCGPVNVLYNIVRFMDLKKFDISIITLARCGELECERFHKLGVKIKNLNLSRLQMQFCHKKILKQQLSEINPDIVHTHCFRSTVYMSYLSDLYRTCVTIHNYPHRDFRFSYGCLIGNIMTKKYLKAIEKFEYKIACSNSISKELKQLYGIKTEYILNGIDTYQFSKNACISVEDLRVRLGIPSDNKVFISVGRLNNVKNPEFLINEFSKMCSSQKLVLLVLGDGNLRAVCKGLASSNIIFTGNVSNVSEYLNIADFFVSSSKSEGLPNSVLEALSLGRPVLLSDIEPHKEIYEMDKKIGRLFRLQSDDFQEQLSTIMEDNYEEMSLAAKDLVVREFSAELMSKRYQKLYLTNCFFYKNKCNEL